VSVVNVARFVQLWISDHDLKDFWRRCDIYLACGTFAMLCLTLAAIEWNLNTVFSTASNIDKTSEIKAAGTARKKATG
jgi:hypothetical protein